MEYLALSGPIYSGKTSLALSLEEQGYMRLRFGDMLKELASIMLQSIDVYVTLADLTDPKIKSKYRGLLQELGVVLDIDNNPNWIDRACEPWLKAGQPPAVIEAIRTPAQAKAVQERGFYLVYLDLTLRDQAARARAQGVSNDDLLRTLQHPVEKHGPTLRKMADVVLNSSVLTIEQLTNELIRQHVYGYDEVAG